MRACPRRSLVAVCVLVALVLLQAPPAAAGTGTWPGGVGERKAFRFEEQRLDDRLAIKANVGTGNLLVKATDLAIAGTGLNLAVERFYNSLSTWNEAMGPGWILGVGHDVRLDVSDPAALVFFAPSGFKTRFNRNADGSYTAETPPGIDATLTRQGDGSYKLDWHSKEKFFFDAGGRWTERKDSNNNSIRFSYSNGLVSSVTDTRNRTVSFAYTSGRLTSLTDQAAGRVFTYGYDAAGRLATSAVTAYALANDNLNIGVQTRYAYDASGRLVRITDPRGNTTTFTYDGTSRKVKTITRVTDPATGTGPTTTFTYLASEDKCDDDPDVDAQREVRVDGPRTDVSDITTHCVDQHDRVVMSFDAKGHKRKGNYTSDSNIATFNDSGVAGAPGFTMQWNTTTPGRLDSMSLPTGGQASFKYDDSIDNPRRPTEVRDFSAGGQSAPATWSYDYDGNPGNLIEAKNAALGITYRYCFNGNGTLDRIAPPPLDGLGLDEANGSSSCVGHPQGNDTLFTYNAKGELTQVDPPGPRGTQTMTYDAVSRLKTRVDGHGVTITYSYDALDRVTRIDFVSSSSTTSATGMAALVIPPDDDDAKHVWVNYSYDTNGNLIARNDSNGNSGFEYDALNRTTKETPETPSAVTTYTYDSADNVKTITAADEPAAVRYFYDSTNLVTSIIDQENRTTTFTYNSKGLRRKTSYPGGAVMEVRYDDSRRTKCIYSYTGTAPAGTTDENCPTASTTLHTFSKYEYGKNGSDTNRREKLTERDGSVTEYAHDQVDRLTSATTTAAGGSTPTRKHVYSYDGESNLIKEELTGTAVANATRTQAYHPDGALCWTAPGTPAASCSSTPTGATTYFFSGDGGLGGTSAGLSALYSLRGHMTSITPPGGQAIAMKYTDVTQDRRILAGNLRMAYNQLGLSAQSNTSGQSNATWFVRDPDGELVGMLAASSTTPDLYYHFDGLGSVAATTNTGGTVVKRYAYEPYGEEIGASGTDRSPWRYAGGYFDNATGMLKFGTRYYMPAVGRWTQRDPALGSASNPLTLSPYGYVGGNPINATDSTGRFLDWDEVVDDVGQLVGETILRTSECALITGSLTLAGAAAGSVAPGPGTASGATVGAVAGVSICAIRTIDQLTTLSEDTQD